MSTASRRTRWTTWQGSVKNVISTVRSGSNQTIRIRQAEPNARLGLHGDVVVRNPDLQLILTENRLKASNAFFRPRSSDCRRLESGFKILLAIC